MCAPNKIKIGLSLWHNLCASLLYLYSRMSS